MQQIFERSIQITLLGTPTTPGFIVFETPSHTPDESFLVIPHSMLHVQIAKHVHEIQNCHNVQARTHNNRAHASQPDASGLVG